MRREYPECGPLACLKRPSDLLSAAEIDLAFRDCAFMAVVRFQRYLRNPYPYLTAESVQQKYSRIVRRLVWC